VTWAEIEKLRILGVITELQAQVLQYRRRDYSIRTIARGMNRSPATIRDHIDAANRRIIAHRSQENAA
jgi:DNA-binding CsgD family transcriptional regulator